MKNHLSFLIIVGIILLLSHNVHSQTTSIDSSSINSTNDSVLVKTVKGESFIGQFQGSTDSTLIYNTSLGKVEINRNQILSVEKIVNENDNDIKRGNAPRVTGFKITIQGGITFPIDKFHQTETKEAGFAKTGFGFGIQGDIMLNDRIYIPTTVFYSQNPLNTIELLKYFGSNFNLTSGDYKTTWVQIGLGFNIISISNGKCSISYQGGMLLSGFPDLVLTSGNIKVTQTAKLATSFAQRIELALRYYKFNIILSYLKATPKYEFVGASLNTKVLVEQELPVQIISLTIGYTL